MDSMILFLDSIRVGQFAKKSRSESFIRSFSQVSGSGESNHGMHGSQLSQSDSAPPSFSFSNDRGSRSSINITTLTKCSGMGGVQLISGCLTCQQDNRLDLAMMVVGGPG